MSRIFTINLYFILIFFLNNMKLTAMNGSSAYLSKMIKTLRKEKGFTQKGLAHAIGVDSKMISYYETGKSIPSVDALIKIAGIFNISVDSLLFKGAAPESFKEKKSIKLPSIYSLSSFRWQLILIAIISLSALITANLLVYNLHKKTNFEKSQKNISRIAERINSKISNIKYASKIIANHQLITNFRKELSIKNEKQHLLLLNTVKELFNASIVYIMDENGTVVACSPYDNGKTLTGKNFRFRPYFTDAMNNSPSVYAALGTTTGERGIYYSYPIFRDQGKEPHGVAVIKMGIDDIDNIISEFKGIAGILSPDGVIFITNREKWLYRTALPIEPYKLEKIHNSKQFADKKLVKLSPPLITDEILIEGLKYSLSKKEIILPGWKVFALEKITGQYPTGISVLASSLIVILTLILFYLIFINQNKKVLRNQRDIAEKSLSESEEKYRIVFENTGTATIIYDDDKVITMCNSRFEDLSGYPRKEIVGNMKWSDFAASDEIQRMENYHSKRGIDKNIPDEYNFRFVNREGKVRDVYIKVGFIPGSKIRVASILPLDFLQQEN